MQISLDMLVNSVEFFLLIFVRMTGLFVTAPIFGRRNIPTYFKVGFAFTVSLLMANTIKVDHLLVVDNFLIYTMYIIKEFIVGIVIGFVAYAVFTCIYIAGQIIDMQMGFGMVNVMDPMSNIQVPVTANLYYMAAMLVFLITNGHHLLLKALFHSYTIIPLGTAVIGPELGDNIGYLFQNILSIGFRIGAPVVAAVIICDIVLGIVSKTIPQMNVFLLGMPIKIFIGLLLLLTTIPSFAYIVSQLTDTMNTDIYKFLKDMVGS